MCEERRKAILKNGKTGNYTVTRSGKLYSENTGKEMKGTPQTTTGRLVVTVRADGEKMLDYIHRIVYRTFVKPDLTKDQKVEFKDGNPYNTSVDNLYLCDVWDDLHKQIQATNNVVIKIAEEFMRCNLSPSAIQEKYKVSRDFVYKIFYKKDFKDLTADYNFYRYGQVYNLNRPPYVKTLIDIIDNDGHKSDAVDVLINQYGLDRMRAKYLYKAFKRAYILRHNDEHDIRFKLDVMTDWLVIMFHNVDECVEILKLLFNISKHEARNKVYTRASKYVNAVRKDED